MLKECLTKFVKRFSFVDIRCVASSSYIQKPAFVASE